MNKALFFFWRIPTLSLVIMTFFAEPGSARPWSVSTAAAQPAECALGASPSGSDRGASFSSVSPSAFVARMGGFKLSGSSAEVVALKILVGDDPAIRLDEQNLPDRCANALCAAEALFGRGVGVRLIHLLLQYGYNASPTAAPGAQPWTAAQLDEILGVFAALPRALFSGSLADVRPLVLVPTPPASERIVELGRGDHGIRLASLWSLYDRYARQAILLHEFAHNLRADLALPTRGKQHALIAWPTVADDGEPVSDYALRNDDEDFAESFVAYLRNPAQLNAVSPQRYAYFRQQIFGGVTRRCSPREFAHQAPSSQKSRRHGS